MHDTGATIVWNAWDEFIVVDPAGEARTVFHLPDFLPEAEYQKWVYRTSAGPDWCGLSLWYFCEIDDELYFVVRTYWDRRLAIKVKTATAVTDVSPFEARLLKEERALVLETLQTWSREDSAGQASDDTWYAATDAAFVAGKVGLTESIPLLQRLDEAAAERQRCYVTSFQNLGYDVDSLRQIVQLSLRRLGVTPAGYSVVFIELRGMQPDWKTPWGRDGRPRADFVEQVQIGSSLPSVIEMIGAPDYARCCWDDDDFDEEHCLRQLFLRALSTDGEWDALFWALGALYAGRGLDVCEYDIDDDMPYTLRVAFFGGRVIKIARLEPVWKETGPRDAELAH